MQRINQFWFYDLGTALTQLKGYTQDTHVHVVLVYLLEADRILTSLLGGQPMPLGVSRTSAQQLKEYIANIIDSKCRVPGPNGELQFKWPDATEQPIYGYSLKYLGSQIETFETVFREEMREAATYFVPMRGIYSTANLVDATDKSFPEDLLSHIPEKARIEWRSAGRCLAFSLLSASGFHVARAVESTLEVYFHFFDTAASKTHRTWNDYIKALEAVKQGHDPMPQARTIAELRQMKDDFRNPLMHPRVVLSEGDARILFNNGETLIIAMAQEISKIAASAQSSLSLVKTSAAPIS
jgi:hypothetical protein